MVVVGRLRRRPRPERRLRQQLRRGRVGDVEELELRARRLVRGGRDVLADPEQQPVGERVEVGGVPLELELADHLRRRRGAEVDRVQRVDLVEGDDVPGVADEPHRVDLLALAEARYLADRREDAALRLEDRHVALAGRRQDRSPPDRPARARDAQEPAVLGERELVEQVTRHLAAREVRRRVGIADVELVDHGDLRRRQLAERQCRRDPLLGRDVEARRRSVDDLGVGHQRGRLRRLQPLREVHGDDVHHPEPGELHRPADRPARRDLTREVAPAADVLEPPRRDPARCRPGELRLDDRVRRRADDDPGARAALAGVDEPAVDGHRLRDRHGRGVVHVDLGDHRLRSVGPVGRGAERCGDRRQPGVDHRRRRDDEHAVAVEQQLRIRACGTEVERPDELRGTRP